MLKFVLKSNEKNTKTDMLRFSNINIFKLLAILPFFGMILFHTQKAMALPADFYAPNSVLSTGKWAKIEVKESGMQFISNTVLRNMGFTDPSKVNVYGYGGRMLPERLYSDMPDDLPPVPSIQTATGIVFFGHGPVGWKTLNGSTQYIHVNNPYSDHSYYFITDSDEERISARKAEALSSNGSEIITVFTERISHEQDLIAPSNTGRLILGEDFRGQSSRSFQFNLPDNVGDAKVTVSFGAKCSGNGSAIILSANGETLPSSAQDQINANASKFIVVTTTTKEVSNPGNSLNLGIQFSGSGSVTTAALDYIEVEYPRQIRLTDGELYFYISPSASSIVKIEGCSENTVVWDVTDVKDIHEIEGTLAGSEFSFTTPGGYREYVAFNPSTVKRAAVAAGHIANQDLHSMEAPGMLVIAPEAYKQEAQRLVALHEKTDGLTVAVITPEQIYNEFSSGNPDLTAYRKLLKMWYDKAQNEGGDYTKYCLILSRPTYDNKMVTSLVKNAGYPRLPIWQSPTGDTESNSYSTDDYIGMLDDNPGELNMSTAKIHVAVGRMPVKSVSELSTALTKLENYMLSPTLGSWRNNVMIIADDQDNGVHLNQAEACHEAMRSAGNGKNFLYEKLYLDSYPLVYSSTGPTYPAAKQRMFDKINEGVLYIDYIGHANPASWGHEQLLTWKDITTFSNKNLPFIYAATCEFLRWDDDAVSGAEEMWLNPTSGVIGMICPSRTVLISANGILNKASSQYVFAGDGKGKATRVGDIMVNGKNAGQADSNKLRYGLIGDPSMRLPYPELNIAVDKINEIDLNSSEMPVIGARSTMTVEGHIEDADGNLLSDFNGTIEIQLYDAEKVITTNANGDDGVESLYNDRKTKLYSGRAIAKDGKWSTTILMPLEIENNYSPALLSLYASDERGREANGACENFYVYGFSSDIPEDVTGPEFIYFYLNGPSFADGSQVSPSPVLKARFRDDSGINVSEAALGHSMIISIDDKTYFNDPAAYFIPDSEDPTCGELTYQLNNISAGEHTLKLTVWDNAANSSTATLSFVVSAGWMPQIEVLTTDVNPASTSVNFIVGTDGISGATKCVVEVYDLLGRKVWGSNATEMSNGSNLTMGWNLQDSNGARVQRGIYIYRATITTANGNTISKSRKLAVTS